MGRTYDWFTTEFLPHILRWHPTQNRPARALRSLRLWLSWGETLDSLVRDYRNEFTVGLEEAPDAPTLRSAVNRLQENLYGLHGVAVPARVFCALLDQFSQVARSIRRPDLHYPASRLELGAEAMESPEALAQAIVRKRQEWGDRPATEQELDMAMRALSVMVEDCAPRLSPQTCRSLAGTLRPLATIVEERLLVQRHLVLSKR